MFGQGYVRLTAATDADDSCPREGKLKCSNSTKNGQTCMFPFLVLGGGGVGPIGVSVCARARATAAFDRAVWEENRLPNAAVATPLSNHNL